jgi:hypothetical protein
MVWLSLELESISCSYSWFYDLFCAEQNVKVIIIVSIFSTSFVFFKYTTIAQGNAQVRRMRTAFDPNDASLQVRLDNQKY